MLAFDEPRIEIGTEPFETRYHTLIANIPIDHPFVVSLKIYIDINL